MKSSAILLARLLIALSLVLPGSGWIPDAEATGYTISGQVTDGGGNPVPNVTIEATLCDLSKQPVLLIHGWGDQDREKMDDLARDEVAFAQLYDWMKADGYVEGCNLFYATGVYPTNSRNKNRKAIQGNLRQAYDQLIVTNPGWRGHFDIIGHSYGGLNARFYLETRYYQQDKKYGDYGIHVDNLFTLGSPHGGVMLFKEAYPGALMIGWDHIRHPENLADFLSASDLFDWAMHSYNIRNWQPKDVCYRLIGGEFLQQDDVPWLVQKLYEPWQDHPGDIGVSLRSSRQLGINSLLPLLYPRVAYVTTEDMHGYTEDLGLGSLRSYAKPADTYVASIRPYLGKPASECSYSGSWQAQAAPGESESVFVPPIFLGGDVLTSGQTISDTFPVDWDGQSVFYVTWEGGDLELTMVDGLGAEVTPAVAGTDPNIRYGKETGEDGGLAAYVFTQTVTGPWTYSVSALAEPYPITYTVHANAETSLLAEAFAPQWQPFGTSVVLTATVTAIGAPVPGATITATVRQPDNSESLLLLRDDGLEPDTVADDGVYAGRFEQTTQGGYYLVWIEAEGSYGGHDYRRTTQTAFSVAPEKAALRQTYADQPVDEDGNGLYDYLEVQAGITVTETGTLALSAVLSSSEAEYIGLANAVAEITTTGIHTFTLQFGGDAIRESGLDGPYTVAPVTLLDDDTLIQVDQDESGWLTAPYDHSRFGPGFPVYLPLVLRGWAGAIGLDAIEASEVSPQALATYETTTDSEGNYTLTDLPGRTYGVVAAQTGYTFTPASRLVKVPPDATTVNFTRQGGGPTPGAFYVASTVNEEIYAFPIAQTAEQGTFVGEGCTAAVADFDNDGAYEILAIRTTDRLLRLYEGNIETGFVERTVSTDAYPLADFTPYSGESAVADFDRNGLMDFAFSGRHCTAPYCSGDGEGLIQIHLNLGSDSFQRVSLDISGFGGRSYEQIAGLDDGDFNSDGIPDLAAQHYWASPGNLTHVFLGNDDATFTQIVAFSRSDADGTPALASADFNNDGFFDLVVGQDDGGDPGQTWLYLGDGTGSFTYFGPAYDTNPAVESGVSVPGNGRADAYHFDADGNADVLVSALDIGLLLFMGDGAGSFQVPIVINPGGDWWKVATPTMVTPMGDPANH